METQMHNTILIHVNIHMFCIRPPENTYEEKTSAQKASVGFNWWALLSTVAGKTEVIALTKASIQHVLVRPLAN